MDPDIRSIANYSTHQDYSIDFFGAELIVTQTETPSVIRRWIRDVVFRHRRSRSSRPLVVGLGVQWTPAPAGYDPPAETLQLCVGRRCIIIQLRYCRRVPDVLRSFLTNPGTTFVGFWNAQDARKLMQSRHQLETGRLLDLSDYVTDRQGRSLRGRSFEEVVETCMGYRGVRLDHAISTSDWSIGYLRRNQIRQASRDAHVCFELGVSLRLWQV